MHAYDMLGWLSLVPSEKSDIFLALEAFTLQDGSRTSLRHPRSYAKKLIPSGDGSAWYHRKIGDFPGLGGLRPPRRFPYQSSPPPSIRKKANSQRGWLSLVRRRIANPVFFELGGSNPPPRAYFCMFTE